MNIKKLDEEITMQTRNGRDTVYIKIQDLLDLGIELPENKVKELESDKEARIYVKVDALNQRIKNYLDKQKDDDLER